MSRGQVVARRNFQNILKNGPRRKRAPKRKNLAQGPRIDLGMYPARSQERLDLRGKDQFPALGAVEKRPNSQAVTRQKQTPVAAVPNGKGELAIEPLQAPSAIFLVGMQQHLSVGRGRESVT